MSLAADSDERKLYRRLLASRHAEKGPRATKEIGDVCTQASLKLNMKVCDAIPGTLNVISEKNAAINENNRFTERFNFELAFNNLPLTLA